MKKDTVIFFLFLMLAVLFWFMHSVGTHKEVIVNVPVIYQNVPKNLKIKNDLPKNIAFTAKDDGFSILSYLFVNKTDTLKIDLSGINAKNKSGSKIFALDSLSAAVSAKMNGTMQILRYEPKLIFIEYNTLQTKHLPVFLSDSIKIANEYILSGKIEITPLFIDIYGEKSDIDTITKIFVKPLNLDSVNKPLKISKQLVDIQDVEFSKKSVQIVIPIDRATEKSVIVPINSVNAPNAFLMRSFPSEAAVKFIVGMRDFNRISASDFVIEADFLQKISDERCILSIKKQPDGIQNVRLEPTQVEFTLEKK